ncbi:MAG: hypothetical protein KDJ20_17145 [Hyphomicrobiales bacterium]|nr:hypothetical protein [Hyphomicrobiales bacterium]MCC2107322.1 hypothetical protein [Hyphomicrobiales bacterium]
MNKLLVILAMSAAVASTSGGLHAQPQSGPGLSPFGTPFQPVIDVGVGPPVRSGPFVDAVVGQPFIACYGPECPRLANVPTGPHPEGPYGSPSVGNGTGGGAGAAAD